VGDMPVYSIFSGLSGVFGLRIGCDKIISSSSYYKTLCVLQPRPSGRPHALSLESVQRDAHIAFCLLFGESTMILEHDKG
jgi:hypothetical protein